MSRTVSLRELHRWILLELDGQWRTQSEISDRLGPGRGYGWIRVALVLERLANDRRVEIRVSGRVRRFRKAA